jgi:hypothetical protein
VLIPKLAALLMMGAFTFEGVRFLNNTVNNLRCFPTKQRSWVLVLLLATLLLLAAFHLFDK